MSTEQLSMSMFANRADYDAAVRAQAEQLPEGLDRAVMLIDGVRGYVIFKSGEDRCSQAIDAIRVEHAQRLALRHHACDLAQRAADLESIVNAPRGTDAQIMKEREISAAAIDGALAFGYQGTDAPEAGHWLLSAHNAGKRIAELEAERDELRAKYDELLVALHGICRALGLAEGDRSPYSVTCGVLERVNRLAEIEAQEPVAKIHADGYWTARRGYDPLSDGQAFLSVYARPVPAQAVPDASRAEAAGHEHAIGHLGALVEAQRLLLVDVEDICGRDGHGGQFEDGESEIIDRVRAHLATMAVPEAAR